MRIVVDRDRCEGHGMCEALAPNLFQVGADGIVIPQVETPAADEVEHVELAVDSCPLAALRLS